MRDIFEEPVKNQKHWAAYPHFEERCLRAIELALRTAWDILQADAEKKVLLSTLNEERISHMLRGVLNDIREMRSGGVNGFNCEVFERPHIGAEIMTATGKIRKPDIVFSLSGWRRPGVSDSMKDAIFVECKILEDGHKNVTEYCNAGLHRFVEGSYAERMREGMMIAYVRTKQTLPNDLQVKLADAKIKKKLSTDGNLLLCELNGIVPRTFISIHGRDWPYPDNEGYPGPIMIRHLWLHV